jgi:manganese oxidase
MKVQRSRRQCLVAAGGLTATAALPGTAQAAELPASGSSPSRWPASSSGGPDHKGLEPGLPERDHTPVLVPGGAKPPTPTTVRWHGVFLVSGMDGVGGISQPIIRPGETHRYERTFRQSGTHMYHPHHDEMTQMAMNDFNLLSMNGKCFPGTESLVAKLGDKVRIRFGNLSAMDHHPIHMHGFSFNVMGTDGGEIPPSARWPETTVLVATGTTRNIEFVADAESDWPMHCHMTHHLMNQMGHGLPNVLGVDLSDLDERIRKLVPGYMRMGATGMGEMAEMRMEVPGNSLSTYFAPGQYDPITMGGMFTLVKVRWDWDGKSDPGWHPHPPESRQGRLGGGTQAERHRGACCCHPARHRSRP